MAELEEAYKRLLERHREAQEKLNELLALAEKVVSAQHQFRRVEMDQFEDLSQALDATLDDLADARARFGQLLREGGE